jgi:hypothetical protein
MIAVAPAPTVVVTVTGEPVPVSVVVSVTVVAPEPATVEVIVVDLTTVETEAPVVVETVDTIMEGARTYIAPSPTTSPTMIPATALMIPAPLRFKESKRDLESIYG